MRARLIITLAALTSVLLVALATPQGSASAQQARPLTLEGKQALYQRVVAIPGAAVAATAGARATQPVTPFTVFYVYAREDIDGEQWLRVRPWGHVEYKPNKAPFRWLLPAPHRRLYLPAALAAAH